jgi:hypothetical protein
MTLVVYHFIEELLLKLKPEGDRTHNKNVKVMACLTGIVMCSTAQSDKH